MRSLLVLPVLALLALPAPGADMTKLTVQVTSADTGKPVDRASVVVRFVEGRSYIKLGKKIRTTWELRTSQEGSVNIPEIPQGKILVQIIAKGYQTFRKSRRRWRSSLIRRRSSSRRTSRSLEAGN